MKDLGVVNFFGENFYLLRLANGSLIGAPATPKMTSEARFNHDLAHMTAEERLEEGIVDDTPEKEDVVNHPTHYTSGGIETITYIKAKLTPEEYRGFLKGTILKYASRAGKKDDELQDTEKQQWYTNKLVEALKDDKR